VKWHGIIATRRRRAAGIKYQRGNKISWRRRGGGKTWRGDSSWRNERRREQARNIGSNINLGVSVGVGINRAAAPRGGGDMTLFRSYNIIIATARRKCQAWLRYLFAPLKIISAAGALACAIISISRWRRGRAAARHIIVFRRQ
jgi:hypothetical protein